MLHAGFDLSRRRLDVCLVDDAGELVAQIAAAPDADGLRHLAARVRAGRVRAVIESMNGARFVHDTRSHRGPPAVRSKKRFQKSVGRWERCPHADDVSTEARGPRG